MSRTDRDTGGKQPSSDWWRDMTNSFDGFSTDYLLDQSTDWSFEPYTHMFVEQTKTADDIAALTEDQADQRRDFIHRAIEKRCKGVPARVRAIDNIVFLTVTDADVLQSLWRTPLSYAKMTFKLVRRGLPWRNVSVWGGHIDSTVAVSELEMYCKSYTVGRKDPVAVLAKMTVDGEGDACIAGDVLIYWSNLSLRKTPKFKGKLLRFLPYGQSEAVDKPNGKDQKHDSK